MTIEHKKSIDRCIYIGGVYHEHDVLKNDAVSPAGNRWQKAFLRGMVGECNEVVLLAHQQERIFPFGSPCPARRGFEWDMAKTFHVKYLNFPAIRSVSLKLGYARALDRALASSNRRCVIVCYNANIWNCHIARKAREQYGIKTICLHLDFPETDGTWNEFRYLAREFAGNVFGSYKAFMESPVRNKFHLDGGFERETVHQMCKTNEGAIVYAGNIAVSKGVEKLIECFSVLAGDSLRLQLFGKLVARDGASRILRLCAKDRRIEYRGVVSYKDLEQALANATVLVNPVDVQMRGNSLNFPSKLHHYLEMGPPVVSAMADGMAPIYRDLIYCVEEDRSQSEWGRLIMAATRETSCAREIRLNRVQAFLRDHLWSRQVARLVSWVGSL